jgi:hypothetical protein
MLRIVRFFNEQAWAALPAGSNRIVLIIPDACIRVLNLLAGIKKGTTATWLLLGDRLFLGMPAANTR